jgi:ferredoxin-NADP reductase
MIGDTLLLQVAAVTDIAPGLRHLRLVAADGGKLPPAAAGAHVQLCWKAPAHLAATPTPGQPARRPRCLGDHRAPGAPPAVARPSSTNSSRPATAGGRLAGQPVRPVRTARHHLMIAGGIGITPFLSYLAEFGSPAPMPLHVCCRETEKDVFAPWLGGSPAVAFHWDADGHRLDIPALLAASRPAPTSTCAARRP